MAKSKVRRMALQKAVTMDLCLDVVSALMLADLKVWPLVVSTVGTWVAVKVEPRVALTAEK